MYVFYKFYSLNDNRPFLMSINSEFDSNRSDKSRFRSGDRWQVVSESIGAGPIELAAVALSHKTLNYQQPNFRASIGKSGELPLDRAAAIVVSPSQLPDKPL
jgi:hypothetical protein